MFNLVRFTLDGVYFVCKTKDLKRHGKKTATKWLDKKLYEVDIITTSQNREALKDICANLNSNVPKIQLKKLVVVEDKMSHDGEEIQMSSNSGLLFPNLEELHPVHGSSDMSEIFEDKMSHDGNEDQLCTSCGLLCSNLDEHLHTVHGSSDISEIVEDKMSHDGNEDQLCTSCGLLCSNLEEHLHTVHGSSDMSEIVENSEVISSEDLQLCQFCGLLCHQLNEHLIIEHDGAECLGDIVEVHMQASPKTYKSKQHFCVYCQTLHFKLARHLENKHLLEEDVQEALRYKKGSSQRKKLILEIQKKGDFLYNTTHEQTISQRRGYDNSPALIPCPYCNGYYKKSYLRNHVRLHCIMKSADRKEKFETQGLSNLISKSRSIVPSALPTASDILTVSQ